MRICIKVIFVTLGVLQYFNVVPHGFAGNTVVGLGYNQNFVSINEISLRFFRKQKTYICTYKEKSQTWKVKPVQAVACCKSDAYFELSFAKNHADSPEVINCSPLQLFYRISDKAWIPAQQLHEGDQLLCKNNETVQLQSKRYVYDPIMLYIIEVKKHHTFVVGRQKILTHNMFIPVATTIGVSIPFDMILGAGSFGCIFGPVTFCCSIAVAGIAAAITYQTTKSKVTEFSLVSDDLHGWDLTIHYNDKDISDAQSPGLPTEHDGFIPKKNWDGKKIKHRRGFGWPDKRGSVWIPTGPNGHGGPHWDVQHPDGTYDNVLPGGKIRGQK